MPFQDQDLLISLLSISSPSGDEHIMADWLTEYLRNSELSEQITITRLRDCLVVTKGEAPKVALFAHIDTCGFTVGYSGKYDLIPIGSPQFTEGASVKILGDTLAQQGQLSLDRSQEYWVSTGLDFNEGDRLIFASEPKISSESVVSPYLDNRAGIWAALQALKNNDCVCICFTTGEETGSSGAIICSKYIYEKLGITQAIISDITWDTGDVKCGQGVAISRRDRLIPSQKHVDKIIDLARNSGIKFQIEIESEGGSDGVGIERSGCPIDWVFVGAPQKSLHSIYEEIYIKDLDAMGQMLTYLVDQLNGSP
jgi:putative aminopeptidase FrvX